jgi:hypothetical protein
MARNPPYSPTTEIPLLRTLIATGADRTLSHQYIAEILNNAYAAENKGLRGRQGVYLMITRIKAGKIPLEKGKRKR